MIIDKTRQFATDEELQELDKLYQEAHQLEDKFAVTHDIDEEMKNVFINIHTKIDCIEEQIEKRYILSLNGDITLILRDTKDILDHLIKDDIQHSENAFITLMSKSIGVPIDEIRQVNNMSDDIACFLAIASYVVSQQRACVYYKLEVESISNLILEKTIQFYPLDKSNLFTMIRQNTATNTLSKIHPKIGKNAELDMITGVATMEKDGLTITMQEFKKLNVRTSAFMLLDYAVMCLTEAGSKKPDVIIPLCDYMKDRNLTSIEETRKQVKKDMETLYNITISFKDKKKGGKNYIDIRLLGAKGIIKHDMIYMYFNVPFYQMLLNSPVMPLCKEIFALDTQKYPHSYHLFRKIQEHKNMNAGKRNENIISVKALLNAANGIPPPEEVKNRNYKARIKKPFEDNMNALQLITWKYQNDNPDMDFDTFLNSNVIIDWKSYPDQTKRLQAKAEKIEKIKAKKKKKQPQ